MQARYLDLQEEEECTPLVVSKTEDLIAGYIFDALLMLHKAVLIPFCLINGDVHGLHPAELNRRFIDNCSKLYLFKMILCSHLSPSYALDWL